MNTEHEELNPALDVETIATVQAAVDWSMAPLWAAAYIAACVDYGADESGSDFPHVEVRGCWVMHDTAQRIHAPDFGITCLEPGEACIIRRPGHEYDSMACLLLRTYFEHANVLNLARDELLEPSPPGWVRPPHPKHTALAAGIMLGLARERSLHPSAGVQSGAQ